MQSWVESSVVGLSLRQTLSDEILISTPSPRHLGRRSGAIRNSFESSSPTPLLALRCEGKSELRLYSCMASPTPSGQQNSLGLGARSWRWGMYSVSA